MAIVIGFTLGRRLEPCCEVPCLKELHCHPCGQPKVKIQVLEEWKVQWSRISILLSMKN